MESAAKDFLGTSADTWKNLAIGDAQMLANGLSDELIATGTVTINSPKHGIVKKTVTASVEFDTVDFPTPLLLTVKSDLEKLRAKSVELVQKTADRAGSDAKGMAGTITDALEAEALKEDAAEK